MWSSFITWMDSLVVKGGKERLIHGEVMTITLSIILIVMKNLMLERESQVHRKGDSSLPWNQFFI